MAVRKEGITSFDRREEAAQMRALRMLAYGRQENGAKQTRLRKNMAVRPPRGNGCS